MTDELAIRLSQLKRENIEYLDYEETIKSYTIKLFKGWTIKCFEDYWFVLTHNKDIVAKTDKFIIILEKLKLLEHNSYYE